MSQCFVAIVLWFCGALRVSRFCPFAFWCLLLAQVGIAVLLVCPSKGTRFAGWMVAIFCSSYGASAAAIAFTDEWR